MSTHIRKPTVKTINQNTNNRDIMFDVAKNLHNVIDMLPPNVRLVAISKYHPKEFIESAYAEGQRIFGESHEQELSQKQLSLPSDIEWHFIGHLQTNKVKFIAPYISMIETVDSLKLLKEINKQALKSNRIIKCLLELHIAAEDTKYGFTFEACRDLFSGIEWRTLKNVQICGIMMMASNVDDENQIRKEMLSARDFFFEIKRDFFSNDDFFCERSYGMSHDYKLAIECDSTMIRVGSRIFGPHIY